MVAVTLCGYAYVATTRQNLEKEENVRLENNPRSPISVENIWAEGGISEHSMVEASVLACGGVRKR